MLDNLRWLAPGLLLTFASAGGQTWFISLSAAAIKQEYGLSDGSWGGLYTPATLASAALMFWQGSVVDRVSPRLVAIGTAGGFAAAAAGMAVGHSVWLLGCSLFLLRFCGQGMFGHIAMTAIGRWFVALRGRAVAIANLGYPASEILLAAPAILTINTLGWRSLWAAAAALLLLAVAPLIGWLLAGSRTPQAMAAQQEQTGLGGRHWQRREAIRHWLLPVLLLPIGLGMAVIGPASQVAFWYVALGLMGVTMGMASALWGAFLPTLYRTRHLGAIRSLSTTIMVFSTAIGPGLTGLLIDQGVNVPTQCLALAGWCFAVSAGSVVIKRRLTRELAA